MIEIRIFPLVKIHVIRIIFHDQAMYVRTSFRGAKTCKIGKKSVLLVIVAYFGKDKLTTKKTACKNVYLGSIFKPETYVFRVHFARLFTRMIPSLNCKCPQGFFRGQNHIRFFFFHTISVVNTGNRNNWHVFSGPIECCTYVAC